MKVICAGLPKTGTKAVTVALTKLGYKVHDSMEQYIYTRDDWEKILRVGGTIEDFKRMYKDVDAVCDIPACFFWEDILQAFPEAKIILTCHENEDTWFEIMQKKIGELKSLRVLRLMSPAFARFNDFNLVVACAVFGVSYVDGRCTFVWDQKLNPTIHKLAYKKHNAYVKATAPEDQLLVYDVNHGWAPLCKFLDVPNPNILFLNEEKSAEHVKQLIRKETKFYHRMKREMLFSLCLFTSLGCYGTYRLYHSSPSTWLCSVARFVERGSKLLTKLAQTDFFD